MALKYILDKNLRDALWNLVLRHNRKGEDLIDAVRVGDAEVVPLGTKDREILSWGEQTSRILVSEHRRSMSIHLADHLASGRHSPGVMTLKKVAALRDVLDFLALAAYATDPEEWADLNRYVP